MDRPYLLGHGILAEELFAVASDAGLEVAGFVENLEPAKSGGRLCDRPIVWVDDLPAGAACVCALSTTRRIRFIEQVRDRARFARLIRPSAVVLSGTELGAGTVVSAGVRIGERVFLNRGASVGHHTRVGDVLTIQLRATPGGAVEVGCGA